MHWRAPRPGFLFAQLSETRARRRNSRDAASKQRPKRRCHRCSRHGSSESPSLPRSVRAEVEVGKVEHWVLFFGWASRSWETTGETWEAPFFNGSQPQMASWRQASNGMWDQHWSRCSSCLPKDGDFQKRTLHGTLTAGF